MAQEPTKKPKIPQLCFKNREHLLAVQQIDGRRMDSFECNIRVLLRARIRSDVSAIVVRGIRAMTRERLVGLFLVRIWRCALMLTVNMFPEAFLVACVEGIVG